MLAAEALNRLNRGLTAALETMGLASGPFGLPHLVEKPAKDAELLFQGYAKAQANKEDAYAAARAFLRGQPLDSWQRDLVASAVATPIREQSNATVLEAKHFPSLLASYEEEAARGELWRLTWHGLLYSYFNYTPVANAPDGGGRNGWETLRSFLERTWPLIDKETGASMVPDWVAVLRREPEVLTTNPVTKYAKAYLAGDTEPAERLAADLGIPPSSWFWSALVLGAVRSATAAKDVEFMRLVPRLLSLVDGHPGFRDEALELVLVRYHACQNPVPDEQLRDYVVGPHVWKNPKLRGAGIATAWNRVPESVWMMVLAWVNERNLKDFFDILASRNQADEGRLAFWSKYMKQITWTRLLFSADTMYLKNTNAAIRDLIAREAGAYAELTSKRDVDAFMMQIGPYIIVEFSKTGNACYVYKNDALPYDRFARYYGGGTEDLASGYYGKDRRAARILHHSGWEYRAEEDLRALGIVPDTQKGSRRTGHIVVGYSSTPSSRDAASTSSSTSRSTSDRSGKKAPRGATFTMGRLEDLVKGYRGAFIKDSRGPSGGRLWVEDPSQAASLARELSALGFKWAAARAAWYFPER